MGRPVQKGKSAGRSRREAGKICAIKIAPPKLPYVTWRPAA